MAIRVSHGQVKDIGRLGLEAGKGEQKVRQEAQQLEMDLNTQSNNARLQAASINANTAITKSILDAQNRKELAEFDSFMRAESERRQIAWQTEKIEAGQRHDFDMQIQRKDLENQMIAERDMRKEAEKDVKRNSLQKAREERRITDDQLYKAMLSIDMDISPQKALFGEGGEIGIQQTSTYKSELTREKKEVAEGKPEAQATNIRQKSIKAIELSYELSPSQVKETQALLDKENLSESDINQITQTLQAAVDSKQLFPSTRGPSYVPTGFDTSQTFFGRRQAKAAAKRKAVKKATERYR